LKNASLTDDEFLDPAALDAELTRVFEKCHDCRRCLPLCPSFPSLFDAIDRHDQEASELTETETREVIDKCYQCKLCYNNCPYTPPHDWDVDFPALMRRHQLARASRDGVPLARQLTTHTDLIGKIGSFAPTLMNFANRNRASRGMMEKTIGIHRDWVQPSFYFETLQRWFKKRGGALSEGANGKVVLFSTCSVNYNDPLTGRAAVEILERSKVRVDLCYERCCGMPFTDTGDLDAARRNAEKNVADLLPYVEAGATIVAPGPSCSLMLKTEYPKLLANEDAERVARGTQDLMEFIYDLARAKKLNRDFKSSLGKVAYHAPCHLRAQNIGFRSRDLLNLAADEVVLVDACSGVDGTWGMQKRFYDESMKVASGMLKRLDAAKPDWVSTDCPLAALRIQKGLGVKPLHPVVLLNRAYQESAS